MTLRGRPTTTDATVAAPDEFSESLGYLAVVFYNLGDGSTGRLSAGATRSLAPAAHSKVS